MCSFLLIHPMLLKRYFLNTLLRPLLHWLCLADTDKCDIRILMIWLTNGNNDNAQESPSSPRPCFHFFCLFSQVFLLLLHLLRLICVVGSFASRGWLLLDCLCFHLGFLCFILKYLFFPFDILSGCMLFPLGFLGCRRFLGAGCFALVFLLSDSISFSGSSFSLLSSAFLFPMATAVAGQVRLTKEYKGQPMYILCDLKNA